MICPCGSNKKYKECCGAIIEAKRKALTPEELMRSRYSAFVKCDNNYLAFSDANNNLYKENIKNLTNWLKLEIIDAYENIVEYKAYYRQNNEIKVLHEKSSFKKIDGIYKYDSGELYNSKIQRNEMCPCGSGKKFKRCCG